MGTRDTQRQGSEVSKAPSVMVDEELLSCKVTLTGASVAFTFASAGLPNMKDINYRITIGGEFAAATRADESTIATTGFTIIGGANGEVAHIFVHGKTATRHS